ncbi:MAG TPA: NAD(P)-dependent oxidoreductase [Pseudonocardiaceae bacterium]|nr:NAD(P)-dependent oxidoreductase [Pseudonocardiaceae bacterium]
MTRATTVPARVLLTGAFGVIGSPTVDTLRANGIAVTALSNVEPDTLPDGVDRLFVGDAGNVDLVRTALADVDAVVHLAAIASPLRADHVDVFAGNTRATFVVLDEAGRAGVRRAAIASSYSVLGMPFAEPDLHPAYVPIDIQTPLQIEDCYALSKQVDEATAHMVARRYGMTVVALRYPFTNTAAVIAERVALVTADPGHAARECWTYLDARDAAEAALLAVTAPLTGAHAVYLAAPETLAPYPTEDLIRAHHPDTEIRRPLPDRTAPIDLEPATRLLGFAARHVVPLATKPLH